MSAAVGDVGARFDYPTLRKRREGWGTRTLVAGMKPKSVLDAQCSHQRRGANATSTRVRERRWSQARKENGGTKVYVDARGAGGFLLPADQQIDRADSTGWAAFRRSRVPM